MCDIVSGTVSGAPKMRAAGIGPFTLHQPPLLPLDSREYPAL